MMRHDYHTGVTITRQLLLGPVELSRVYMNTRYSV
ncbi:hypothetical protein JI435_406150 [Parastagonospora nodorum SN15]|uniref:Uncharacterized protein n=1 Tax=Phaeosphaeria nodorum (strain SN15 / ATCC MYA-4574 / FGSC 10173) TaxID=321614 RepID=A0A7U2EXR8_PHANO|nr:hypothetical protein JI435_406150 [Parastagonospora nodorum SN15]